MKKSQIIWKACKEIFKTSDNDNLVRLLESVLGIIKKNYSDFEKCADLDFLKYVVNLKVDEYVIGRNGDDFKLRLNQYIQQENVSLEDIWKILSQLIWDLIIPVTERICPFCKSDYLVLLTDKENKHIYEFCETCFWTMEKDVQVKRRGNLFPANKILVKKWTVSRN